MFSIVIETPMAGRQRCCFSFSSSAVQVYWFNLLSLPLKEAIFSIEPPFSKFVKLSDKSFQEGDLEIILGMSVLVPASK